MPSSNRFALVLICSILFVPLSITQQQVPGPEQPAMPGMSNPDNRNNSAADDNPAMQHMAQRMAMQRNNDRQKQIVNDTARLLQLAQQLNADVSKSDKNTLSVGVVKKAEEIEKLAKSIKQKMRDGQ